MNSSYIPAHPPTQLSSPSLSNEAIISIVGVFVTVLVPLSGLALRRRISRAFKHPTPGAIDIEIVPMFMTREPPHDLGTPISTHVERLGHSSSGPNLTAMS
ncbi:hypothetical protein HDK64DRAFT_305104 [Phyllosticta capitalensis]